MFYGDGFYHIFFNKAYHVKNVLKLFLFGGCGFIFAAGLSVSQMINPKKVLAFLDITGDWDPSLMFVMAGALIVMGFASGYSKKSSKPLLHPQFEISAYKKIDGPLILGAIIFEIGWGWVGLCPGPALAGLVYLHASSWTFFIAMLIGMALHRLTSKR